jgi:crossover junction endodeoxyribonuclease RuvC
LRRLSAWSELTAHPTRRDAVRTIGIDPGGTGALAFLTLDADGRPTNLEIVDMPVGKVGKRTRVDVYALAREIDARMKDEDGQPGEPFDVAMIEQGGVRPLNGRVGAGTFWMGVGALHGVLAANFIPIETCVPRAWRSALRVTGDKDASRLRASAIFPRWAALWSRAKDHGRAEAALIALHGANKLPSLGARKSA